MLWLWRTLKNQKPPHSVVLLGLVRCPNVQFAPMASLVSRASETVCSHLSVESKYPKLPCCCNLLWPRSASPTERNVFTPHTYTFRSSFCTLCLMCATVLLHAIGRFFLFDRLYLAASGQLWSSWCLIHSLLCFAIGESASLLFSSSWFVHMAYKGVHSLHKTSLEVHKTGSW
jgi:hypothetical protein